MKKFFEEIAASTDIKQQNKLCVELLTSLKTIQDNQQMFNLLMSNVLRYKLIDLVIFAKQSNHRESLNAFWKWSNLLEDEIGQPSKFFQIDDRDNNNAALLLKYLFCIEIKILLFDNCMQFENDREKESFRKKIFKLVDNQEDARNLNKSSMYERSLESILAAKVLHLSLSYEQYLQKSEFFNIPTFKDWIMKYPYGEGVIFPKTFIHLSRGLMLCNTQLVTEISEYLGCYPFLNAKVDERDYSKIPIALPMSCTVLKPKFSDNKVEEKILLNKLILEMPKILFCFSKIVDDELTILDRPKILQMKNENVLDILNILDKMKKERLFFMLENNSSKQSVNVGIKKI